MVNLGVEMIHSSQAIEAVEDKLYTHQILAQNNLPILRTMLVRFPCVVKLEIAGVDLLFDDAQYCICEVNSAAGFSGFEAATGVNVARALNSAQPC
jgi:glutathione synthase/RimK-type ligase-like ATP-grasp enzyme